MKYIVRSLKYFVYLSIVFAIFVLLLYAFKIVGGGVNEIFRNGMDSVWKIAIIIAVFSAIYPAIGYGSRSALIPGAFGDIRAGVLETMEERGYRLEEEDGENLSFVKRSPVQRLAGMYEDRLRFERTMSGFEIEGRVKDLVRVISALEARFRPE